jgi:hypothetical protein
MKYSYPLFSVTEHGKKEKRFAKDVSPLVNSSWSLVPIRRVVDAQHVRGLVNAYSIELISGFQRMRR